MKKSDVVEHIETNFDVESIQFKGLSLWLEVRYRLFTKLFSGEESSLKIDRTVYKIVLKSFFYGFFNWFKKYDVWFLGNSINRLKVDGLYYDRLFDYPASKFKRSLFIELTSAGHFKRNQIASKYIVSRSPLVLLEKVISLFISIKKIDLSIIEEIKKKYDISYDPDYAIKKMISQYRVMSFLLKIKCPKMVFIAPSYTAYGYVKAFHDKGVKVVEIQHGVIQKEHYGYNIKTSFDRSYFPDLLLTLGNREKAVFEFNNYSFSPESIVPVGSFYIDHIRENFVIDPEILSIKKEYSKSFTVSLQELPVGELLITFLVNIAKNNPSCLFFLKPRTLSKSYFITKFNLPSNMIVVEDINVYELILSADYHVTLYSTCALEAPALGKMNILVNIDNKAQEIFGETLNNKATTVFVETELEFQEFINQLNSTEEISVEGAHSEIICSNYKENMDKLLNQIYE